MATIANLLVKLGVDNKNLKKGFKKALSDGRKFANNMAKSFLKITTALSIGIAGASALVLKSINDTAEGIDNLAKTSKKLGIGVSELQKLQFQAQLSGVNVRTLNMALQRMVRRVSEAAQGLGEGKAALKELGLDAAKLAAMAPEKQFQTIAQAMQGIKSQTDRVRLSFKLFDSEGVALVNTLNSNLAQTSKEFDKLGISLTKQQATAVEAYTDSQTKLSAIWKGFKQQLTVVLAGPLTEILKKTLEWVKGMGGLDKIARQAAKTMIMGAKGIFEAFSVVVSVVLELKEALRSAGELLVPLLRKVGAFVKAGFVGAGTAIGEGIGFLEIAAGNAAGQKNITQPGMTFRTKAADIIESDFSVAKKEEAAALTRGLAARQLQQQRSSKFNNILSQFDTAAQAAGGVPARATQAQQGTSPEVKVIMEIATDTPLLLKKMELDAKFLNIIEKKLQETTKDAARQVNR